MQRWIYRNLYMRSLGWALTKWIRKDSKCKKCSSTYPLHLHHLDYRGYRKLGLLAFFLPDLVSKMQTLCAYHHWMAHGKG